MNVLVVGATGVMGRETVRQLLQAGNRVRAMTRTPEKAADLERMGAEVVQGDLIDPPSLARACQGMEAVISAAHSLLGTGKYSSKAVDEGGQRALIVAAKAADVQFFVFPSMQGASLDSPLDFARHKATVERYLQSSGINYTILRPSAFMEWHTHTFLGKDILEKGQVTILGKGETRANFIAGRDVAAFAVLALTNPRACNRTMEIGGPDNITRNRLAQMNMQHAGKSAKVGHLPRAMLRVMSVVMRPFKPEVARIMLLSYLTDTNNQSMHIEKQQAEFPMDLLRLKDFVKARVAEWKAAA